MYIIYKTELHGVGFGYQIETFFGDALLFVQYLDDRCEFFFYDSHENLISIPLDQNEARILSQLINPDRS
ncbi:hypothetical protein KFZ56_05985 [Virgibacillus sp. NKC19-3]|uniref:hypothetical protein n=1 Tax=Virgibacillus saliphilus TaxID=2831674 RepID=UPI001C9AE309|nr:hypothetical protein [Virgibacillus sp. NKC19-3]MBY7142634.1 hypothetical protein [Virgibacillus sp. NKC19-3]